MNADGTKSVVLVVEDEDSLRDMLGIALRLRSYEPIVRANGLSAKEVLDGPDRVDAILLDLKMAGMTGQQLLAYVRQQPQRAKLPIIVISGFNDEVHEAEVVALGADAFLGKPFRIDELMVHLERLVPKH